MKLLFAFLPRHGSFLPLARRRKVLHRLQPRRPAAPSSRRSATSLAAHRTERASPHRGIASDYCYAVDGVFILVLVPPATRSSFTRDALSYLAEAKPISAASGNLVKYISEWHSFRTIRNSLSVINGGERAKD